MKKIEDKNLKKLKDLYKQIADLTRPKCAGEGLGACNPKLSCCDSMYCDLAEERAKKFGVELQPTGHLTLKFMGTEGCSIEPYLRPLCSAHVCERAYSYDPVFSKKYFALRAKLSKLEFEMDIV